MQGHEENTRPQHVYFSLQESHSFLWNKTLQQQSLSLKGLLSCVETVHENRVKLCPTTSFSSIIPKENMSLVVLSGTPHLVPGAM